MYSYNLNDKIYVTDDFDLVIAAAIKNPSAFYLSIQSAKNYTINEKKSLVYMMKLAKKLHV